mmetsp:Transcript_27239/g.57303  ORF Transcript_27239/g.57303 Transcript_27239/m.57303 type:complete len:86 (+) Transcript_27239:1345-1602(+)
MILVNRVHIEGKLSCNWQLRHRSNFGCNNVCIDSQMRVWQRTKSTMKSDKSKALHAKNTHIATLRRSTIEARKKTSPLTKQTKKS